MKLNTLFCLPFFLLLPSLAFGGVVWNTPPLDKHLADAKKANSMVVLKFDASWCPSCQDLKKEVFQTDAGEKAFEGLIPVVVDFDIPANRILVERYVVLGLPTVVVLNAAGKQVGRIAGFETPADWLSEFSQARKGQGLLTDIAAKFNKSPTSPKVVLDYGHTLLVNGQIKEGLKHLKHAQSLDEKAIAAEALFLQGRYFHRVKQDPKTAQGIWHQLVTGHSQSDYFKTGLWWYARSCHELNSTEQAITTFKKLTLSGPIELFGMWQSFLKKYELVEGTIIWKQSIRARLKTKLNDDDRESLELLLKGSTPTH